MTLRLRPAHEHDAENLVLLRIAAMRESLERIGRFDAQRARDRFLSAFVPHCTQHIESGGKPVGFVVVKPMADGLFLEHLYIHPDCQRQGIGRWVLQQVFHEADVLGQTIKVGALKGSEANRFYVRHGFRLVEQTEWDNYYLREARPLGGTT